MTDETNDLGKLRDLVRPDDIGMLATLDGDGQFEARPMALRDFDEAGRLWFFTEFQAPKADQVFADPLALVTFSVVTAAVNGESPDIGANEKVDL